MDTNRLSIPLEQALNNQVTREAQAAQIYLSFAAWAERQGYSGIANFLFRHANEERNHMMKFLEYILRRGGEVRLTAIAAPPDNPRSINHCFEKIFEHEVENTKAIYHVAKLSHEEEDWATWNFIQWFIKEQVEEESLAMRLKDKIKIAGGENADHASLYALDHDLEKMPDDMEGAEKATADHPL